MSFISLLSISIGLGMDAFAVSICKGLSMKKMDWKKGIIIGLYFGIFQAIMPIIGYILGEGLEEKIRNIDHWIIFILLGIIGINMIKETFEDKKEEINDFTDIKTMVILSLATSIDALAVRNYISTYGNKHFLCKYSNRSYSIFIIYHWSKNWK